MESTAELRIVRQDEIEDDKKKRALGAYEGIVSRIMDIVEMQRSIAYENFVADCRTKIEQSKKALVYLDKPRDIAHSQEAIKVLTSVLAYFKEPVDDLDEFKRNNPLFAPDCPLSARWDPDTATIIIA